MKIALELCFLILGFVLLLKGADVLVTNASSVAQRSQTSSYTLGFTVVALGTSLPEIAISIISGIQDNNTVLIGDVIGSNILNIFLILAIVSLICPIAIKDRSSIFGLCIATLIYALIGIIAGFYWWEGLLLIVLYVIFTIKLFKTQDKSQHNLLKGSIDKYSKPRSEKLSYAILYIITGIIGIMIGALFIVDSVTYIAEKVLNISSSVVALTVVAIGTSLPELATSIAAARKKNTEMILGNIIGSNLANLFLVTGLGLVFSSSAVFFDIAAAIDFIVMIVAAITLLFYSRKRCLSKAFGLTALGIFILYYLWLLLNLGLSVI